MVSTARSPRSACSRARRSARAARRRSPTRPSAGTSATAPKPRAPQPPRPPANHLVPEPMCRERVYHAYQYGGTYDAVLTITDIAGNKGVVEHEITVDRRPPSGSAAGPAAAAAGLAGRPGPSSGAASLLANGGRSWVPAPVAAAAIPKQSLHSAVRKGLVVSYSVNEQVAGHFELLLSRSTARRLHVSGPAATGMAPGAAPQVVIAKAILITTKGGRQHGFDQALQAHRRAPRARAQSVADAAPDRAQRGGQESAHDNRRQQRHAHRLSPSSLQSEEESFLRFVAGLLAEHEVPQRDQQDVAEGDDRDDRDDRDAGAVARRRFAIERQRQGQRSEAEQVHALGGRARGRASGARRSRRCWSPPTCQRDA